MVATRRFRPAIPELWCLVACVLASGLRAASVASPIRSCASPGAVTHPPTPVSTGRAEVLAGDPPLRSLPPVVGRLVLRGGGKGGDNHHQKTNQEEPVLCRYKKGGTHFEIMCLPTMVEQFRGGKVARDDAVVGREVFKDAKKGDRPSAAELEAAFGTASHEECIDIVLAQGEYQLTVAQRKAKTDEKFAAIVNYICSNYIEGGTKRAIPAVRVEESMNHLKGLKIDPFRSVWFQAQDIAKKLKEPLKLVKNEISATVTVKMALAGPASGVLHSNGGIAKVVEEYEEDSATFTFDFTAGEHERIVSDLTKATGGEYELKIVGADAAPGEGGADAGGGGGDEAGRKGKKGKKK